MSISLRRPLGLMSALAVIALASSASAHPPRGGGWGGQSWGDSRWGDSSWDGPQRSAARTDRSREGKVIVDRFVADGDAAAALGHGRIAVAAAPGTDADGRELATYEAAVIDQLARAGYDTATADPAGGQLTELTISHDVIEPEESPRKPLTGEMSVGVSNRGSMVGMALAYDGTKPLKALVATRLEARIRDKVSGNVLWEGRATILTRDGDDHWSQSAIAGKLAAELFDRFPAASGEQVALR